MRKNCYKKVLGYNSTKFSYSDHENNHEINYTDQEKLFLRKKWNYN